MKTLCLAALGLAAAAGCTHSPVPAPPAAQPTPGRAEAMAKLSFMRGIWAGPASGTSQEGKPYKVTQTERIGPMLGGDVIVIEGRGYREDNTTGFNAFAVVSWEPRTGKYEIRSYAMGFAGTFELTPTSDGYVWEIPLGPEAVLRYTAVVKDGRWREVGEYLATGKPPVQTFEMNLKRVGDTDWPLDNPVDPSVGR
jgi:hypothetical protein